MHVYLSMCIRAYVYEYQDFEMTANVFIARMITVEKTDELRTSYKRPACAKQVVFA